MRPPGPELALALALTLAQMLLHRDASVTMSSWARGPSPRVPHAALLSTTRPRSRSALRRVASGWRPSPGTIRHEELKVHSETYQTAQVAGGWSDPLHIFRHDRPHPQRPDQSAV